MRVYLSNTGLALFSILFCLVIAEVFIRIVMPEHDQIKSRNWLLSSETFQLDHNGAVRYLPNKHIRSVTVSDGKIVEDVGFYTNNLGLIDHDDYEYESVAGRRYYAFVGDSFTAGFHGGEAWVPKLRADLNDENIQIYNLGVSGTGFEHFQRLVSSVGTQLLITDIVIIAISHDIYRTFWYPVTNSSEVRFCRESENQLACLARPPLAVVFDHASTKQEVIDIAARTAALADQQLFSEVAVEQKDLKYYLKQSRLLVRVNSTIRSLTQVDNDIHISRSLKSVEKIQTEFPQTRLHFIHLPSLEEVASGSYFIKNLGEGITKLGIEYFPALSKCNWSVQMFSGQHPNQVGYQNVANCVSSYLFSETKAGVSPVN